MLGDVDLYGLYLMGIGSCCIAAKGNFIFSEYIFRFVHISEGYGAVDHVVVCYIVILVICGGSTDDPLQITG